MQKINIRINLFIMYFVYSLQAQCYEYLPDGFIVVDEPINMMSSFHSFVWSLLKGNGTYYKTLLKKNGETVCCAEVIEKCPLLRFLPSGCIHIGPCKTPIEHRGNGYYPMLIRYITGCYLGRDCYMFVHETNKASIRGIEKAGFIKVGTCRKFLNVYY